MVAGRAPFEGATAAEVFAALLDSEPPPLRQSAAGIPSELERIVSKALVKDREERYQTAQDLLLDLRSLKEGLDFEAKLARPGAAVGRRHWERSEGQRHTPAEEGRRARFQTPGI